MKRANNCTVVPAALPAVLSLDLSPVPEYPIEERGVYVSRFFSAEGEYVLNAIDRRGRLVARASFTNDASWYDVEQALIARLDEIDPPPPKLKLIHGNYVNHARGYPNNYELA